MSPEVSEDEPLRVLLIGAGGLGAPALLALGAAGVRHVTVLEPDRVELGNLHRQIIYRERDVGRPKAEAAREVFLARWPRAQVRTIRGAFDASFEPLLAEHDVVLDGTDRFETKLSISDACVRAGVPYVFAGVVGFEGQVLGVLPGRSACLRCLFEDAPPPGTAPTCAELGILGPVAGIVAAHQVAVARSLSGDAPEVDRLWSYDGRRNRGRVVPLRRDPSCTGCGSGTRVLAPAPARTAPQLEAPELDLTAEVCPATYRLTRRALDRLPLGGRLWVLLASDESARNVPASVVAAGHHVLAHHSDGTGHRILIERGGDEGVLPLEDHRGAIS